MGPFGCGRSSLDSGPYGICSVMLAQLEGLQFSSVGMAL